MRDPSLNDTLESDSRTQIKPEYPSPGRGLLANPMRDIADVRTAEGKLHLFVAIGLTKFAFVQLHTKATRRIAGDFLRALAKAVYEVIRKAWTTDTKRFILDPLAALHATLPEQIAQLAQGDLRLLLAGL